MTERTWQAEQDDAPVGRRRSDREVDLGFEVSCSIRLARIAELLLLYTGRLAKAALNQDSTAGGLKHQPMHVVNPRTSNGGLNEIPAENCPRV